MRATPIATLMVKGSWNSATPMKMAVNGSRMPMMDVFVAPIDFEAAARVIVATAVGKIAKPATFSQHDASGILLSCNPHLEKKNKTIEPTRKQ